MSLKKERNKRTKRMKEWCQRHYESLRMLSGPGTGYADF